MKPFVDWDARAHAVAIAIAALYAERNARRHPNDPPIEVLRVSHVAAAVAYPAMFDVTRVGRHMTHKVNHYLLDARLHVGYRAGWFTVRPDASHVGAAI